MIIALEVLKTSVPAAISGQISQYRIKKRVVISSTPVTCVLETTTGRGVATRFVALLLLSYLSLFFEIPHISRKPSLSKDSPRGWFLAL